MQGAQDSVRSADGTEIAVDRSGSGPALVMVDPAGGYSGFDNLRGLGALLAAGFTVYAYDRRGRGESGDTEPYAVAREVEDLAAVIAEAGGSAFVYGFSSGGLLALHAAAGGLAIDKLALFEPPVRGEDEPPGTGFTAEIDELVSSGRRAAAVDRFLTSIGVPSEVIEQMAPVRPAFEAVAHTLVYDCEISNAITFELLRSVQTPTLVPTSGRSGASGGSFAASRRSESRSSWPPRCSRPSRCRRASSARRARPLPPLRPAIRARCPRRGRGSWPWAQQGRRFPVELPARWRGAGADRARLLLEKAHATMRDLESVRETERVTSGPGTFVRTDYTSAATAARRSDGAASAYKLVLSEPEPEPRPKVSGRPLFTDVTVQ